ncbi:MAG: 1-acyl-sn-glycerol-3-phosphate acyltransferase [Bacteriovoracaceae bacterium]|nr:1-acyl-sn-glycerol-3-phosphate acyltransferase [Bacteriovoracaceae bacterium]
MLSFILKCWILFFCLCFLPFLSLLALLVYFFPLRTRNCFLGGLWKYGCRFLLQFGFFAHVHKEDLRPTKKIQGLLVSNHLGMLDIPLLQSEYPIPPIMKKELARIPLFGFICKTAGGIMVDRKDPTSRKQAFVTAQKRLLDDYPVQVYPEGTRQTSQGPAPVEKIHRALIDFSYQQKVPVTPISLYGTRDALKKGKIISGVHMAMITHHPLYPQDFENADAFLQKVWGTVCSGYESLQKKYGHV